MKMEVFNLEGGVVGDIQADPSVFGVEVHKQAIARVVRYQLAKRRSGNHASKEIWAISGTTRKPHAQKGTGRARQGSLRSPQFRGGAVIFGPVVRSHAHKLPKAIRRLGLKSALVQKINTGSFKVVDSFGIPEIKTKVAKKIIDVFGGGKILFVGKKSLDINLKASLNNIVGCDFLEDIGLNVYDLLKHEKVLLSKDSFLAVQERLRG